MNKPELAQYLVNLIAIMESKESAGSARGNTLAQEYTKHYNLLTEAIQKENNDGETRSGSAGSTFDNLRGSSQTRKV